MSRSTSETLRHVTIEKKIHAISIQHLVFLLYLGRLAIFGSAWSLSSWDKVVCLFQIARWFARWKGSSNMFKESHIACCLQAGLDLSTEKKKAVTDPLTHQRALSIFPKWLSFKIRRCLNISLNYIHCRHICLHRVMWHVFWLHFKQMRQKQCGTCPRTVLAVLGSRCGDMFLQSKVQSVPTEDGHWLPLPATCAASLIQK